MILVQAALLLLLLFLLGLPLSSQLRKPSPSYLRFVLAPHFGLCLLVIFVVNANLLNLSVTQTVLPIATLAVVAGGIAVWHREPLRNGSASAKRSRYKQLLAPSGLVLVTLFVYYIPFILNPDLTFYANAGTDGSAYIAISEYEMNHGAWDHPVENIYSPTANLVGRFLRPQDNWIEKPGTNGTLAFSSSLFRRLPHEMFSVIMLVAIVLTFGSIFALAQTLSYSPLASGLAAFVGTLSPTVLVLTSNTYLSASLTLPILPVLLLLTEELMSSLIGASLFGLVYQAYWLISPPSFIIPPGVMSLGLAYLFLSRIRREASKVLQNGALMMGTFVLLNPATYKILLPNTVQISAYAFAVAAPVPRIAMGAMERRWEWGLFWHTIGVGPIVASPATTLNPTAKAAFLCVVIVAVLYFVRCAVKGDYSVLFFAYLSFWLMVVVGGLAGAFKSFEILSRVSQQLVFLHALVYASFLSDFRPSWRKGRRVHLLPTICLAGLLLFITVYSGKPFMDFENEALFISPQRVNQFTRTSLGVRQDLGRFAGDAPVLLNSSVPTWTGLLNIAVLFSNLHLMVPPEFLKFFLFPPATPLPADYFCAKSILVPEMYRDIYRPDLGASSFRKAGFAVVRNDLIPFLNNDTFPIKYGFDAEFLKQHSLTQARTLGDATSIFLCSAAPRDIKLQFRYSPVSSPQTVEAEVGPSQQRASFVFDGQGVVDAPPISLVRGQNRIDLKPAPGGAKVEVTDLSVIQQ